MGSIHVSTAVNNAMNREYTQKCNCWILWQLFWILMRSFLFSIVVTYYYFVCVRKFLFVGCVSVCMCTRRLEEGARCLLSPHLMSLRQCFSLNQEFVACWSHIKPPFSSAHSTGVTGVWCVCVQLHPACYMGAGILAQVLMLCSRHFTNWAISPASVLLHIAVPQSFHYSTSFSTLSLLPFSGNHPNVCEVMR